VPTYLAEIRVCGFRACSLQSICYSRLISCYFF
jgi:hypothetical protein